MSYREPASPELREETARRRRMEDEDRARRAADIDSDDSFEPPFERTFGDGGGGSGVGSTPSGGTAPTTPPHMLLFLSASVNSARNVVTLQFNAAVDPVTAAVEGRFTLSLDGAALNLVPSLITTVGTTITMRYGTLAPNATYTITINALTSPLRRLDDIGVALSEPFSKTFDTTLPPLAVVSLVANAGTDATIRLVFNRAIRESTAITTRFQVARTVTPGGTETIASPVSVNARNNLVDLRGLSLLASTAYTLRILPGITDTTLPTPVPLFPITEDSLEIPFEVGAGPVLDLVSIDRAGATVSATFTNPIDPATVGSTSLRVRVAPEGSFTRSTSVALDPSNARRLVYTATDTAEFVEGTTYRVTFASNLRDTFGQRLPAGEYGEFTVRFSFFVVANTVTYDRDTRTVSFTFNRDVALNTIRGVRQQADFTVRPLRAVGTAGVVTAVTLAGDRRTVTLTLERPLIGGQQYQLVVGSTVTDTASPPNAHNGLPRLFDVAASFVAIEEPELTASASGITFTLSQAPIGTGSSGRLSSSQIRVLNTSDSNRDLIHTYPVTRSGEMIVNLRNYSRPATLLFQLSTGILASGTGEALMGGTGARRVTDGADSYWQWTLAALASVAPTSLDVESVAATGPRTIVVTFSEEPHSSVSTASFSLIGRSINVQTRSISGDTVTLTLDRDLSSGAGYILRTAAGVRSAASAARVTAQTSTPFTYTPSTGTFTLAGTSWDADDSELVCTFTDALASGSLVSHLRPSAGLSVTGAMRGATTTTAIVRLAPPVAGTHNILWLPSLRSAAGGTLGGTAAQRTSSFTQAVTPTGAGTLGRDTALDSYRVGTRTITLGYSGLAVPTTTAAGTPVTDTGGWTVRRGVTAITVTGVERTATSITLTLATALAANTGYVVTGPRVNDGSQVVQLGSTFTTGFA